MKTLSWSDARAVALVLLATLLLAAPWLPQGLDFTDDGWHLTNQAGLLRSHGLPADRWGGLVWGSDLLGAACMPGDGAPDLLRQRLGWLAMILASAVAAWLLARSAGGSTAAAWAVALAVPVSLAHGTRMIVDYNRAPFLLMLVGLAIARLGRGERPALGRAFAGGLVLGLAAFARVPGLPVVLLPFLPPLVTRFAERRWDAPRLREALASLAGSALVSIPCAAVLGSAAVPVADDGHSLGVLAPTYLRQAAAVAGLTFVWMLVGRALSACAPRSTGITCAGVAIAGSALVVAGFRFATPGAVSAWFVLAVVAACLAVLRATRRGDDLLLLGLSAAFLNGVGSNNGLTKMAHGLILVVPAAFVEAMRASPDAARRTLCWMVLATLAAAGVAVRTRYPYRDAPDRRVLVASVDHPGLAGIRTGASRARSVEDLLVALERECAPGDLVLAYGSIPMTHYLTRTRPLLDHAWPDLLPVAELERRFVRVAERKAMPAVVVRARVSVEDPRWGYADTGPPPYPAQVAAMDGWRDDHGYTECWSNREFAVYVRRR